MNLYRSAYELVLMMMIMCVFQLEEILEGNRYVKQICRFTSVCFSPLFYISFVCLPTCVCVTRSSIRYLELGVNLSTFSFDDQV